MIITGAGVHNYVIILGDLTKHFRVNKIIPFQSAAINPLEWFSFKLAIGLVLVG